MVFTPCAPTHRQIIVVSWNILSLRSALRWGAITKYLYDVANNVDILCLQETRLPSTFRGWEPESPGLLSERKFFDSLRALNRDSKMQVISNGFEHNIEVLENLFPYSYCQVGETKGYAGTAILSKHAPTCVFPSPETDEERVYRRTHESPLWMPRRVIPPSRSIPVPYEKRTKKKCNEPQPDTGNRGDTGEDDGAVDDNSKLIFRDGRVLACSFDQLNLTVICAYVPVGYAPDDPDKCFKLRKYKCTQWLPWLQQYIINMSDQPRPPTSTSNKGTYESHGGQLGSLQVPTVDNTSPMGVIVCGDFNVAHSQNDAPSEYPSDGAGVSSVEREAFTNLLTSTNLIDSYRYLHPYTTDVYSWWDFRNDAMRLNHGLRLDYVLLSPAVMKEWTLRETFVARGVQGSDHCPVGLVMDAPRADMSA